MTKIAIAIPTNNREKLLERLLQTLGSYELSQKPDIFVIDNEKSTDTQKICDKHNHKPYKVFYVGVDTEGIATARNKALDVIKDYDFLAFLDDDDIPQQNWLDELLKAANANNADIVCGYALPEYEGKRKEWMPSAEEVLSFIKDDKERYQNFLISLNNKIR